ncbi:hypothetical protein WOC76_04305 [Methylocystis sp. IM3]|uniref:hypothetical protein n=1 Tax=unclassified Methylocystis TaxID=2625913 RepID=UPI0030F9E8A2
MGAAAPFLSLAATGLGAMGSISAGNTAAANARQAGQDQWMSAFYSSEQAQLASQVGMLRAQQTDAFMRRQQEGVRANLDAVLALNNASDRSPSSWAVRSRYEALSDEARTTAVSNIRMDAAAKRNAAALYAMSGQRAMSLADANANNLQMNGILGAAGGLLKAIAPNRPGDPYSNGFAGFYF